MDERTDDERTDDERLEEETDREAGPERTADQRTQQDAGLTGSSAQEPEDGSRVGADDAD